MLQQTLIEYMHSVSVLLQINEYAKSYLVTTGYFLISVQVIDLGGEPITTGQYTHLGRVTEFKYGAKIGTIFRKWNGEKLSYTKYESNFLTC